MVRRKLTEKDIKEIQDLLQQGHDVPELAVRYGVSRSVIYRRAKDPYIARGIPLETRNKVIKAIEEGYTKAEAAQMYGLNIGTVYNLTRGIVEGHHTQGNHIIRKNGIMLLNRLMTDGYLVSDFVVSTVRNLQMKFPVIKSARYRDKTFFFLPGREEETIEAFFKEKADRIISYSSVEEMAFLLGVKISKEDQRNLVDRYKHKHTQYWESRRLIQRRLEDFVPDLEYTPVSEWAELSFRLFPKNQEENIYKP
jgi:Mor family transcriptional regulator